MDDVVARPVERVIVVGAGISGLTVASALAHSGIECVVLEARDRVGGRLHTIDLAGTAVDLGGSWIHHPDGNPLRAFAEQVGVSCRAGDPLPDLSAFDLAEGQLLTPAELAASLELQFDTFPREMERLQAGLSEDGPATDGIETYLATADLAPVDTRRARQALRALVEADAAAPAERQSLRWWGNDLEYGGDFFGDLPTGGYRSLVEAMATGLDIRMGVDVAEVEVSPSAVQVRTKDGLSHNGSHVVVTVPLGVLKQGIPRFVPSLPPDRVTAIESLGFGRYEKVALRFEQPFWRSAGLSHLILFRGEPDQPALWVIDQDAFGAGPALVCHVFHSAAGRVLEDPPDTSAQWVLGMLAEAVGRSLPDPLAVAVTSWAVDPYARGAYTNIPPGGNPTQLELLGEPVGGRLLFAGEHTQSARTGYADGAMTSGIREARRLLNVPNVSLGPIAGALS